MQVKMQNKVKEKKTYATKKFLHLAMIKLMLILNIDNYYGYQRL